MSLLMLKGFNQIDFPCSASDCFTELTSYYCIATKLPVIARF